MNTVRVKLPRAARAKTDWSALRRELGVVDAFPADVLAEAERAAGNPQYDRVDRTDIPLFTIDPAGSRDLDQAMFLEQASDGYVVWYAIADVAAFVQPDSALDGETHRRGETLYCPDLTVPLLPDVLSAGAASLLPMQDRPALLWRLDLDHRADVHTAHVERALVRSRRQLDYDAAPSTHDPQVDLLLEIGNKRIQLAHERGAVEIGTAEQIVAENSHGLALSYRAETELEACNAQISLLTGMTAARMMLDARIGVLRTLPPPSPTALESLRRSAQGLDISWPADESYPAFVSRLRSTVPLEAAMLNLAARLLRGASYIAFDGELPANAEHSAVASQYAHCTAPLRRLVDRYVNEICLSICGEKSVPAWVHDALPNLPSEMDASNRRSQALERATIALAEAVVLQARVGEVFDATVVEAGPKGSLVQIAHPAVRARCTGDGLVSGASVRVRLVSSDPARRDVQFEVIDA
jgi:exoribonuclease R